MAESDARAGSALDGTSKDVTRFAPLVASVLLGCFAKPPFDGRANDASVMDGADATAVDVLGDGGVTANIAFVTAMPLVVGSIGDLATADTVCAQRAVAAGLPANNYVAWLSSGTTTASGRLGATAQGWVRVDGLPVANTRANLTAGAIYHPIRIDENGQDVGSVTVGTATIPGGTTAVSGDCAELTGTSESLRFGLSDATRSSWTDDGGSISCNAPVRMYCFGTNFTVPVAPPVAQGRFAFLSSPWTPGGGTSGADGHCQSLADSRSLPGTYVAFLATTMASAPSRLVDGLPWVRVDGIPLAPTASEVIDGKLTAPLNVDVSGTYTNREAVWTGVPASGLVTAMSTAEDTCADWTDTGGFASTGINVRTASAWFFENVGTTTCTNQRRLYCFQR